MHYCYSSLLLIGVVAPLALASPVPHFSLPFHRSTVFGRSWNGTIEKRTWKVPDPIIILHQTLNETHPYFSFLSKIKRHSHHNFPSRTTANSTETAKVPIPLETPPPPPKFHPEIFDPNIYTIKHRERKDAATIPTAAPKQNEEKRQIAYSGPGYPTPPPHYGSPPYLPPQPGYNFPTPSGLGGPIVPPSNPIPEQAEPNDDQPLDPEDEDERAKQEGPEASQMPPGHPVPENSPSPAAFDPRAPDVAEETFPLVGNVRNRDGMAVRELQQMAEKMSFHSVEDVEEVKKLAREITAAEYREKPRNEKKNLVKRDINEGDIMNAGQAQEQWKKSLHVAVDVNGKKIVRGMMTAEHRQPFGKRGVVVSPSIEGSQNVEDQKFTEQIEVSRNEENGGEKVEAEAKAVDDTKAAANGPYGYGPYNGGGGYNYSPLNGGGPYGYPNGHGGGGRGGYGYDGRGYKK